MLCKWPTVQSSLHCFVLQSARKRLEKENHELKEQISQEERMHKGQER